MSYLTGGELTALTMVYWTRDPFQNGQPDWLKLSMAGLYYKGLAEIFGNKGEIRLTPKGECLMGAILALPEPVNQWVIP